MLNTNRPKRAAIYARYSTDMQSAASIDDQLRLCRRICEAQGWSVVEEFRDEAISGQTDCRPGFEALRQKGQDGHFDVVVSESMDRLSRDQEHIAGLYKRLAFRDCELFTQAEGLVNEMLVGMKGTMNALFIKDLGAKTRRGQEGRVHTGKSAGGCGYGYRVDRQLLPDGTWTTGDLMIVPEEVRVVHRIFREYDQGQSSRAIAVGLNRDGIPAPRSGKGTGTWSFSTISGNRKRGTGILNNELYLGVRVWNRQRYVKDPTTGKRQARANPPEKWVRNEVPELRLVDDDLWARIKHRQGAVRDVMINAGDNGGPDVNVLGTARRAKYLFSGLLKCGCCGGSYTLMNKTKYGCASNRNKGTCDNRKLIKREEVEDRVLNGLKGKLLHPTMLTAFVTEYHLEWNRLQRNTVSERSAATAELKVVTQKIDKIVEAITEGMFHISMKAKMDNLEARKVAIVAKLDAMSSDEPVHLHPALAQVYEDKIGALAASLNDDATRPEAIELLRGLVSEVRLHPDKDASSGHTIELFGELAAIFELSEPRNDKARRIKGGVSVTMVAGVGFEPTTFRL
ncbi:putative recombinase/resolvase [Octadecabacter antarcticus 307]|uniref:Putative recombinase/resolvase n=1 Tax=Octadecabacter antarcticus 307 TaxID=391626 RepID=M9RDM3_9RHOB|nr:recombinase family protein [Octadecabacter antarcticus]AGI69858.1 putative recombinase/resolvase [Octadecabacter antarcticus 307]